MGDDDVFNKRKGTTNPGSDYEHLFMANLVLDLISDDKIEDFKLSSNDDSFGAFDDVVIEIKFVSGEGQNYAFQLKHGTKSLTEKNLVKEKGSFVIKKYLKDFIKVKKDKLNFNLYKCILFTSCKFDNKHGTKITLDENFDVEILECQSEPILKNNHGKGRCYKLHANPKVVTREYQEFFDRFFLYTNQLKVHHLKERASNKFQQTFCCEENIFTEYFKFITDWSVGKVGEKQKLTKIWMKHAIAIRLLSPFMQPISCNTPGDDESPKSELLREATSKFDVTIFNEDNHDRVARIWTDVKREFKQNDIQKINEIRKKFHTTSSHIKTVNDLNDKECSKLMWLADMCPLIVSENESVAKATTLCENKKLIVLGNASFAKNVSVFRNLSDLRAEPDLHGKILKTFKCSLQGKRKITLRNLIGENDEIEKLITTDELVLMLDDSYTIGGGKEDLPESYIKRSLSRHIVDPKFLEKAGKNTVIIITSPEVINLKTNHCNIINIEEFLFKKSLEKDEDRAKQATSEGVERNVSEEKGKVIKKDIYISKFNCSQQKCETLCKKIQEKMKYHHFRAIENDELEWIRSKGGISDLQEFRIENHFISEKELLSSEGGYNINIVCENPGMGKSSLMKNVKNNDVPSLWTVLIHPKDHSKHFREKGCDLDEFQNYIRCQTLKSNDSFEAKLLEILFRENRIRYIWDGLDEISEKNLQIVLYIIQMFATKGLRQWITARNHLKSLLESKFETLARTIKQFDEEEQKRYIKKRLTCSEDDLEDIFVKIKNNIQQFTKSEILGIPLQIYMFTTLFRQNSKKYNALLENMFSLTDLYSYFIDEKFNFYHKYRENINESNDEINERNEEYKKRQINHYEKAAMRTYFDHEALKHLNINCEKFLTKIKKHGDPVGIITEVSRQNISNYAHNSYGEYFAAMYLSKNPKIMSKFSNFIFGERYKNIRFMFDSILSQGLEAHIAVLYQNSAVLRACSQKQLEQRDAGGRNALHLACSSGQSYPYQKIKKSGTFNKKYKVSRYQQYECCKKFNQENPEYHDVLRHLISKCDPHEKDQIFNLTSFEYANKACCLLPLLMLLNVHKISFGDIKKVDRHLILYYAALFNFPKVFDRSKNIPLIYNSYKESLLVVTASHNLPAVLKKLIVIQNYRNLFKKEAQLLMAEACKRGHYEIVELLIESKVSVAFKNMDGDGPLHSACKNEHYGIVKLLIKCGMINDFENNDGDRPLDIVCKNGNFEIVKLLVESGVSINYENKYGYRPFDLACRNTHSEIVKFLIERDKSIEFRSKTGDRPLHTECRNGNYKIVKLLIECGMNVNCKNNYDERPIDIACRKGHYEIVKLLIENGVTVKDKNGDSPLHIACKMGNYEIIKLLIDSGANINSEDRSGEKPIHIACGRENYKIVKLLIKCGASVNSKTKCGDRPLHLACRKGSYKIVKLLIKENAKIHAKNNYSDKPVQIAIRNRFYSIVKLFET